MTFSKQALFVTALCAFLSSSAHAAQPLPAITDERNAAAGFAITLDLITNSMTANCAKLGGEFEKTAPEARAKWKERNGSFVDSAHKYLILVRVLVAKERGEEAGRVFYEKQTAEFIRQSQASLVGNFPSGQVDVVRCKKVVQAIGEGTMDIKQKDEFFKSLLEIQADMSSFERVIRKSN